MPFCSALASARVFSSSSFTRRAASSSVTTCIASRIFRRRSRRRPLPRPESMPWICEVSSSIPGGARISICGWLAATSISISLSSSSPSRSFLRNFCRVAIVFGSELLGTHQHVENALLRRILRARAHAPRRLLARLLHADLDQIPHDGVDVAADVADLGELGGLDLDERRVGQPREAARDLGLAHAGRADHQDVLRRDLGAHRLGDLLAAPAVAQRDRDRALRLLLPDDVLVELVDDLLRRHAAHSSVSMLLADWCRCRCRRRWRAPCRRFPSAKASSSRAARAPPPAHRARPSRWRGCRARARARRPCR